MKKRSTSIPSFNETTPKGLWSPIRAVAFIFLMLSCGICTLSCETEKPAVSPSKSKVNSPPTITSVTILPERPTRENDLSLIIQSQDPDGDLVSYRYQWIKNDVEMPGETSHLLKAGNFRKGDALQVRVIPSDGKAEGKPFPSNPMKISNTPPVVSEVWIEPRTPSIQNDLTVHHKSTDADGDSVFFSYQWEKNGAALLEERKEILTRDRLRKGDTISVTVIPDDKEIMGEPKKSGPVTILNSPPVIKSSPPFSTDGTKYTYEVKAVDPDNDPITFSLKSGPKGMKIDQKTGLIQWEIKKEDQGAHTIEIEARDTEGATSYQRYTLAIEVR